MDDVSIEFKILTSLWFIQKIMNLIRLFLIRENLRMRCNRYNINWSNWLLLNILDTRNILDHANDFKQQIWKFQMSKIQTCVYMSIMCPHVYHVYTCVYMWISDTFFIIKEDISFQINGYFVKLISIWIEKKPYYVLLFIMQLLFFLLINWRQFSYHFKKLQIILIHFYTFLYFRLYYLP